jgi:hypothetical protein
MLHPKRQNASPRAGESEVQNRALPERGARSNQRSIPSLGAFVVVGQGQLTLPGLSKVFPSELIHPAQFPNGLQFSIGVFHAGLVR